MELKFNPSPEEIARATGKPLANIQKSLDGLKQAMLKHGILNIQEVIATIATVATECPFLPINEYGGEKYWKQYEGRKDLGNINPGDGVKFHGRGFVQLTGRANYDKYGKKIGKDLISNPDLALDPAVAAEILCIYLKDHGVTTWALRGHWLKCRMLVNGGTNGLQYFLETVWKLLSLAYSQKK